MARHKKTYMVAQFAEETYLPICVVANSTAGAAAIKAQGEDGKRYQVIATCGPLVTVKVEKVEKRTVSEAGQS